MTRRMRGRMMWGALIGSLLAFAPATATAAAATPPDLTWSGASNSIYWSTGGNWAGATAPLPDESLGTLSFPQLNGCSSSAVCYVGNNDVSGLTANAISVDDTAGYEMSGQSIALGAGGLTAAPGSPVNSAAPDVSWAIPLTLTADQSWSITGDPGAAGYAGNLVLDDPVTGSGALNVTLANAGQFNITKGMAVGAFAATGADTGDSGFTAALNGTIYPTSLNSSPATPVAVTDLALADEPNVTGQPHTNEIGPLTASGALLDVGDGNTPDGILAVQGGVTLNSGTTTQFFIDQGGSVPSTDYSQLTATGDVALGGSLVIETPDCASLGTGSTDTLVSTTGTLSGTFAGIPNGAIVSFTGCPSLAAQIDYTANDVTATVVSGGSTSTALSASPTSATTNQPVTLTATVTAGSPQAAGPAGVVEFLDGSGPVAGCSAQPLTATNATTGTATCTITAAAAAAPTLSAVYTPSGSGLTGSTSPPLTLTVARGASATRVAASAAAPSVGQRVTYTAAVAPALSGALAPTGSVAFTDHGAVIPGCAAESLSATGTATCTMSYAVTGAHAVIATYQGDGNFTGSASSALAVTVQSSGTPGHGTATATIGHHHTSGAVSHVSVACAGDAKCSVKLSLSAAETLRGGRVIAVSASKRVHREVDLGTLRVTLAAGQRRTLTLTLNRAGKRLLSERHRLSVKLTLTQTVSGQTRRVTTTLTFKAPKMRKAKPKR